MKKLTFKQVLKKLEELGCTNIVRDGRFYVELTLPNGNRGNYDPRDLLDDVYGDNPLGLPTVATAPDAQEVNSAPTVKYRRVNIGDSIEITCKGIKLGGIVTYADNPLMTPDGELLIPSQPFYSVNFNRFSDGSPVNWKQQFDGGEITFHRAKLSPVATAPDAQEGLGDSAPIDGSAPNEEEIFMQSFQMEDESIYLGAEPSSTAPDAQEGGAESLTWDSIDTTPDYMIATAPLPLPAQGGDIVDSFLAMIDDVMNSAPPVEKSPHWELGSRAIVDFDQCMEILQMGEDGGIYVNRGLDWWGDSYSIVESWEDVKKLQKIAIDFLPPELIAEIPLNILGNYRDDLDWILGEWGFSDQHDQCSNCYVILQMDDMNPQFWINQLTGEITCARCTSAHYGEEYLNYCAQSWGGGNRYEGESYSKEILRPHFIDPMDYGFTRLNAWEDYEGELEGEDHKDLPHGIECATGGELERLYKAARIIDDSIQIVVGYGKYSTSYVIYARLDPNGEYWSREYSRKEDGSLDWESARDVLRDSAPDVLTYAMGRIFAKYHKIK